MKGWLLIMNKYDKRLHYLRKTWIGEVMTISKLGKLSEDCTQWDKCYSYKNFLEEGCRAFCNYLFSSEDDKEEYNVEDKFRYFYDKDTERKNGKVMIFAAYGQNSKLLMHMIRKPGGKIWLM